ncbi:hypothetical protein HRED_05968 [Candidatus Haloredivivus sp. G17]|nr:hypothetical protein HRED_05968 [Candidatus Haloredivivus sp. G17]
MEKVEIGEPERLLKEIDFSKVVLDEKKALRIGSKVYILALGMVNNEFYLSNIKGDLEGVDKSPEEVRKEINVYSETELENVKRSFLNSGYLKQQEGSSSYRITDDGKLLFQTYLKLFRCFQLSKKMEYLEIEKNLSGLESLEEIRKDTSTLSQEMKEEMIEKMERGENHSEQFVHVGLADNKETEGQINRNAIQFLNELWDVKENILKLKNEALYNPEMSSEEIDELEQLLERVSDPVSNPEFMEEQLNDLMNPVSIEDIEEEVEEKLADLNL